MPALPSALAALVAAVPPADSCAATDTAARLDRLVKPPGSLGRLEDLAVRLAAATGHCPPPVPTAPAVIVAAADHGVHAQGVTAWPQQITTAMVAAMCAGQAAVNALAATVGAEVHVLDVGCADAPPAHPRLWRRRVRAGTADLTTGPAMSEAEAVQAVTAGADVAAALVAAGTDLVAVGDMGIANTTASACLIGACVGVDADAVTGPGAGADTAALRHKAAVVRDALARHAPDPADPLGVLRAVGGLEHAAIVGILLAAAAHRVPVVLDGVITNAAALVAARLCPAVTDHLIPAHRSPEPGAAIALRALGLRPLLDLGLRLGEGTGALLAVPLVGAAARAVRDMATLDDLGA